MIHCLIIDDEPPAIKVIEHYIQQVPDLALAGSYTDPVAGMVAIESRQADLLFLDINMPQLSGIDLIKSLANPPLIVLTTAYPEYAVEGFELEVLDYLLKPIALNRFLKTTSKAKKALARQSSPSGATDHLIIREERKLFKIPLNDILYFQAWGDYVKIFCKGRTFLPKETLKSIEQRLPQELFLRTHRSYIVALQAINFVEGNQIGLNNVKLPVSQSYKELLLRHFS